MENQTHAHARQIHLDFHTSSEIPDVGCDFDAEAFADQLVEARVNSVTLFAKCHHGQCYYPTRTGVTHPALKGRDLLGEQLEAVKRRGLRAPIYTTVVWEEDVAQKHPEWRQLRKDGTFAEWRQATDHTTIQPGYWKFNDFMNPDYQDYFEAHIRELLERYEVDGFFVDILFYHRDGTWSDPCRALRRELRLEGDDQEASYRLEWEAQRRFMEKFNAIIHGIQPKAHVFYNQQNNAFIDGSMGFQAMSKLQSQIEVESLPSGYWGYHHFPKLGRQAFIMGQPWLGMTGRFQRQWGDFGGIKPVPALEFECFRAQALGGACSVGDQLPPRGILDKGAYRLIGEVYKEVERAEPFYAGSEAHPEVAILHPGHPALDVEETDLSLEGALLMCEERHYDCAVIDDSCEDLSAFRLLILPDSVVATAPLKDKLRAYLDAGGKVIASYRSGFAKDGSWVFTGDGLQAGEDILDYPTYWRGREAGLGEQDGSDRVIYQPGLEVSAGEGWSVLVDRVLPYFRRSDYRFSSHFQTPPMAEPCSWPAVFGSKQVIYFSDPIFREYRRYGSVFLRKVWEEAAERLIGAPAYGQGLPVSVLVYPRQSAASTLLTLLHYIPVRKSLEMDVIEDRQGFHGLELKVPEGITKVVDWESGEALPSAGEGVFRLPAKRGRLLLSLT